MMRICATKYLEKIFAVNIYKEHVAKIYIRKKASYDLEMKRQFNWKKKRTMIWTNISQKYLENKHIRRC